MKKCKKCGGKVALCSDYISEIDPDSEPFEASVEKKLDSLPFNMEIVANVCVECNYIQDIFIQAGHNSEIKKIIISEKN